jgi:hypothetical protein
MNDARLKVQVGAPLRVGHRGRSTSPQPAARSPQPAARDRTLPACCATSTAAHCLLPLPERVVQCCAHRPIALCGPMGHLTSIGSPLWSAVLSHGTPPHSSALLSIASHRCACCAWAADASASHTHSHAHARATAHARTHAHLNLCAGAVHRRAARLQGRLPARRQRRAAVPSGGGPRAALLALDAQACDPATR